MDMIGEWIRDIAVFLIVSAAVLHAVPGKDYRKYIRFFTGLILILLLAEPILELSGMARRDPDPPAGGADPGTVRHGPPV